MKAADIMTTELITISSFRTIAEAAKVMKEHNLRALIVERTSEEDAYSIITASDIAKAVAQGQNLKETYVCAVMTKPCIVVNPDLAVEHIANLFTRAQIRIAPVIKDKLLGVVSLTDILTKTDCLTSQKHKELVEFSLNESIDDKWQIESESIYENWCSG